MASLKAKEIFCLIYSGLLFLSGLVLMGISSYLLFKIFYHYTFIPSGNVGPFFVIFLLGIVHLFLTWLGIKGPTREHNFHIVLFMIFTLILLACEFAVGVWSIVLWDDAEVGSIDLMTSSFDEMITQNYNRKDWNKLESQMHCCGVKGVEDYNKTHSIPQSCLLNLSTNVTKSLQVHAEGCKLPLIKYLKRILIDGAAIGFCCTIFQAFGIYAFYSFFKTLREERAERMARRIALQRELTRENQMQSPLASPPRSGVSRAASIPATPPTTPPVIAPT